MIRYAKSAIEFVVIRQQRGNGGAMDKYTVFKGDRDSAMIQAGMEMGKISGWVDNMGDPIEWIMSDESTNFSMMWYSQIYRESGRYIIMVKRAR